MLLYRESLYDSIMRNSATGEENSETSGSENIKESFVEGPKKPVNLSMNPHHITGAFPAPSLWPNATKFLKQGNAQLAVKKDVKLIASEGNIEKHKRKNEPAKKAKLVTSDHQCLIF